jgi:hypothetical protein
MSAKRMLMAHPTRSALAPNRVRRALGSGFLEHQMTGYRSGPGAG